MVLFASQKTKENATKKQQSCFQLTKTFEINSKRQKGLQMTT